MPNRQLLGQPN